MTSREAKYYSLEAAHKIHAKLLAEEKKKEWEIEYQNRVQEHKARKELRRKYVAERKKNLKRIAKSKGYLLQSQRGGGNASIWALALPDNEPIPTSVCDRYGLKKRRRDCWRMNAPDSGFYYKGRDVDLLEILEKMPPAGALLQEIAAAKQVYEDYNGYGRPVLVCGDCLRAGKIPQVLSYCIHCDDERAA